MTDAEQWLADLEAKARDAEQGDWKPVIKEFFGDVSSDVEVNNGTVAYDLNPDDAAFIAAANPATVLRLVGMVRWLAAQRQELLSGYCPEDMRVGCLGNCIDCRHGQIAIKSAYAATEDHHAHD